jgi:hypothetical protein
MARPVSRAGCAYFTTARRKKAKEMEAATFALTAGESPLKIILIPLMMGQNSRRAEQKGRITIEYGRNGGC